MTAQAMTPLLGPADAGNFRVNVGRYGDRWYTDPLPACELAPASDWRGPSVSTTKPPFANKYVPMRSCAEMPSAEWARLAGVDVDTRYEAIKANDKLAGRINMDRGSLVHLFAEDRLNGRTPLRDPSRFSPAAHTAAERFRPALEQFFDAYQPTLVAAEVVCLHRDLNGVGYGGTADAFVEIEGDVWAVDWKSRNSDHGAYLEEAAQGGAYIGAQYMIAAGLDGGAVRVSVPKVAGVLIVSICVDSYRAYPIAAEGAISAYAEMHRWWVAQRAVIDNDVIGRPWAPKLPSPGTNAAASPPSSDRRQALRDRYNLLDDADKHVFVERQIDGDDLDAIEAALDAIDPFTSTVIETPAAVIIDNRPERPELPTQPDEGADVGDVEFEALEIVYDALTPTVKAWFGSVVSQAREAAVPFHGNVSTGRRTVRRFKIYRGLLALAGAQPMTLGEDELVRQIVATVWNDDRAFVPAFTVGQIVGALTADDATRFAELCVALCDDAAAVDVRQRPAA